MAKKNENAQKKVSKWEAAPKSIQNLYFAINGLFDELFDGLSSIIGQEDANDKEKALNKLLSRVLDDYNELEAKHQEETGMISEYEEENRNLKSELDIKTDVCNALQNDMDIYRSNWVNANEKLGQLRTLLAVVDVTTKHEDKDNDGVGHWCVCNNLVKKNRELEDEIHRYEQELHCVLENIESALGIQRIHLASSYGDRADYIIKKIKDDKINYSLNKILERSNYGLYNGSHDLIKKNLELEVELHRYEQELNYMLEKMEAALGIQQIHLCHVTRDHLTSSYDDRAACVVKKIYDLYSLVVQNGPETLESLKKFLKDEYKFDVNFIRTNPDEGFWKLIQRGPNVFNRKSNNFRWAFRGAMECLGMSPGAIAAEIIWTSNSKVTPTDISLKWSQRACEKFETKE